MTLLAVDGLEVRYGPATAVRDGATWGKRAAWCDYYGPVGDKTVGVAIFDHPANPRHPTWWHVRDYGLFAANPFGQHDFESLSDKAAGNLTVPVGKSITFRYRFYLHTGDEQEGKVAEADRFSRFRIDFRSLSGHFTPLTRFLSLLNPALASKRSISTGLEGG